MERTLENTPAEIRVGWTGRGGLWIELNCWTELFISLFLHLWWICVVLILLSDAAVDGRDIHTSLKRKYI